LNSTSSIIVLIRRNLEWNSNILIEKQLIVLNIPTTDISIDKFSLENLNLLMKYGVGSYFDLLQSNGVLENFSQNAIDNTKTKLRKIILDIQTLHKEIQIPDLLSNVPIQIQNWLNENANKNHQEIIQQSSDLFNDINLLNSMQSIIHLWIKKIQSIIQLSHDPLNGTVSDEIMFWNIKQNVLTAIKEQLESPKIILLSQLLHSKKRTHTAVALLSNTSLKNSLKIATLNNDFLKHLNVNNIITPESFEQLQINTETFFENFKRIKFFKYPIERAIDILTLFTTEFETQILDIIANYSLFANDKDEFEAILKQVKTQIDLFDNDLRISINFIREILRKQANSFVSIKINTPVYINDILQEIKNIRNMRNEMDESILLVMNNLNSKSEDQISTYEKLYLESNTAYNALNTIPTKSLFSKNMNYINTQKTNYMQQISFVERKMVSLLKVIFLNCNADSDSLFGLFEQFQLILSKPQVRIMLQEFHTILLQASEKELEELEFQCKKQLQITNIFLCKRIPTFSSNLYWIKQVLNLVAKLFNHLELILTKDWANYPEGKRFSTKISALLSEINIDILYNNWLDITNKRIENSILNSSIFLEKPVNNKIEYNVNIDYTDLELNEEIKCLRTLNFSIPGSIKLYADKISIIYKYASYLDESLKQFYSLYIKVNEFRELKMLILPNIKNTLSLISDLKEKTWLDVIKSEEIRKKGLNLNKSSVLDSILEFQQKITMFNEQILILNSIKKNFFQLFDELKTCEFSNEVISDKILKIQDSLSPVFKMKIFSSTEFLEKLNVKIKKIAIEKCNKELKIFYRKWNSNDLSSLFETENHQIIVHDYSISIKPSLEFFKEHSIGSLNNIIAVLTNLKQLTNLNYITTSDTPTYQIENENFMDMYRDCLNLLLKNFAKAKRFYSTWTSLEFIWDVEILKLSEIKENDLSLWLALFEKLKLIRETFDTVDTNKTFGLINIEYEHAQRRVYTQFSLLQRTLLESFGNILQNFIKTVNKDLLNLKEHFQNQFFDLNKPQSIISILSYISKAKIYLTTNDELLIQIKSGNYILAKYRFNYSESWIPFSEIENNVQLLDKLISHNTNYLNSHMEIIKSAVNNEIHGLSKEISIARAKWQNQKPTEETSIQNVPLILQNFEKMFNDLNKSVEKISYGCKLLDISFTINLKKDIDELSHLQYVWNIVIKLESSLNSIKNIGWNMIELPEIRSKLEDSLTLSRSLPANIKSYPALGAVLLSIKNTLQQIPFLSLLKDGSLNKTHWTEIFENISSKKIPDVILLGDILDLDLLKHEKYIRSVVSTAEAENLLSESIKDLEISWDEQKFEVYTFNAHVSLLSGADNLFNKIGDDINTLQSIMNSPYYPKFAHRVRVIEDKLNKISDITSAFYEAQKQWVYLSGIFADKDELKILLPLDLSRFENVSYEFKYLINLILKTSIVIDIIEISDISITTKRITASLLKIRKSLISYLEKQREQFPRFYFIGNDDLLEFIGNATNSFVIAKHIKKIFPGVSSVIYDEKMMLISGIVSAENENIQLLQPVSLIKNQGLISWLHALEKSIKLALSFTLDKALETLDQILISLNREGFINMVTIYPSQILNLAFQIYWTEKIENSIVAVQYEELLRKLDLVLVFLTGLIKNNLTALTRIKIENLLIEIIHKHEIATLLKKNNFDTIENIIWFSHQKYYYDPKATDPTKNVTILHGTFATKYAYEYLGAAKKLAYTPLLTSTFTLLAESMDQKLGGLLLGPAGTGKTETVKALGYNLGRIVFVFCCDESFDVESVSRILLGISQIGAFACFDEFNRLDENILSGIATQIEKIQNGLFEESEIAISGKKSLVHADTGIFITNNPNYEGRSMLPDNLKSKFLTYRMMVPDSEIITRVLLSTQGFIESARLASIMVEFFKNMELLCSKQKHYDFGLRNLKSVIVHSGKFSRVSSSDNCPKFTELNIIQKSCYDVILPRLVKSDEEVFYNEIAKFGEPFEQLNNNNIFLTTLLRVAKSKGLSANNDWVLKCTQLYEISKLNHGFMLVGKSCTGKSTTFDSVIEAIAITTGRQNECFRLNPKVLSKNAIFGQLDYTTREWKDGILTSILRKKNENYKNDETKQTWIIFDGAIDPIWAENLNSVLDDNKLLTLPSGERILLPDSVTIVFEVDSLLHVTPATISRCGIILFNKPYFSINTLFEKLLKDFQGKDIEDSDHIDKSLIQSNKSVKDFKDILINTVYQILDDATLISIWNACILFKSVLKTTEHKAVLNIIRYLNKIFRVFIDYISGHSYLSHCNPTDFFSKNIFLIVLWSFAGEFSLTDKILFTKKLLEISKFQHIEDLSSAEKLIYMVVDPADNKFKYLGDTLPSINLQPHMILGSNVVIPTIDTASYEYMIYSILEQHQPLVLCGPPGSGKTMLLLASVRKSTSFELLNMNFSRETTIDSVLKSLEQSCQYNKTLNGITLSPKTPGKWLVLFCDEVNLPKADKYNIQPVIEFLRQIVVHRQFWHPKTQVLVTLQNIQFVGACNPTSMSNRYEISDRFINFCTTLMIDYPSAESLKTIYNVYTTSLLRTVPDAIGYSSPISNAMVEVYIKYTGKFQNSNIPHYVSSPRELTRWIKGLYVALKPLITISLESLIRLWAHEGIRLFHDKLIHQEERDWVYNIIFKIASQNFPHTDIQKALESPILFSDWLTYEYQSVDKESLRKFVKERFNVFSQEESNVQVVLYDDLLDHVLRIDRVLKNDQGHMILVGPSGSGKTTLTKFVAWMNGIQVVQLNVTKAFSLEDFEKILRDLLTRCAIHSEKICFVIDESTILHDSFLEKMNNLLANAEVPGLFEGDKYDELMNLCLKASQSLGLILDSSDEIYRWFVKQISQNFHVVFTMSDPYAKNSTPFISSSALFNRCVVNWIGTWSKTSLSTVAIKLTSTLPLDQSDYKKEKEGGHLGLRKVITDTLVAINLSASLQFDCEISPSQFLHFLRAFTSIFVERESTLQDLNSHVNKGLDHLKETFLKVKQLGKLLKEKETQLQIADDESRKLLDKMIMDQNESERKQDMSIKMQELFADQEKTIIHRRKVVVNELNEVETLIEEAEKGVLNIKKQHLTELRSMHNPPETIKMVLESICIMLGYDVSTWRDVQQVIRKDDFIASIISFNSEEQVNAGLIDYMQKTYMSKDNFNYESANRASKACGPLLMWVKAQLQFSSIVIKVKPLKAELRTLEEQLIDTKSKLIAIDSMITDLKDEVEKYKVYYSENIRIKENIKIEMESVKEKLDRSIELIKSLNNERQRWEINILEYEKKKNYFLGDSVLLAAFTTYCGFALPLVREKLLNSWKDILSNNDVSFDPAITLSHMPGLFSADDIICWQRKGLPNDEQFIGNTAILTSTFNNRFSFVIDPSGLFADFLPKLIEPKQLTVSSFLDPEFNKKLENCVKFGGSFLIQDGEYYNPIINRLISRDFTLLGAGRTMIRLGDKEIDLSPEFKLYILTKDSSISIPTFISSRMDILNYSFTESTLLNESLNITLEVRDPKVESQRLELMKKTIDCKSQLRLYENDLLNIMSSSKDNILDDDKLLTKLEVLKKETNVLEIQMKEIDETIASYNEIRSQFTPLACFYADLIQIFNNFSNVNKVYRFSNDYVKKIFKKVLLNTVHKPMTTVKTEFAKLVYKSTSNLLLQKDKLLFKKILEKLTDVKSFEDMTIEQDILDSQFIILRTSKGNDSTVRLKQFADGKQIETIKYALGSNEGYRTANKLILDNKNSNLWLIIENIEMSGEFLEFITDLIESLKSKQITEEVKFKLIMTCKIDANIPLLFIQSCKQIIIENEISLKKSISDILFIETSMLNIHKLSDIQPKELKKVFFVLSWYYSLLIARLRYADTACQYEINQSDLQNAFKFIFKYVNSKYLADSNFRFTTGTFEIIGYVVCNLLFGGKVEDKTGMNTIVECGCLLLDISMFSDTFNLLQLSSSSKLQLFAPVGYITLDYVTFIENLPDEEPMEWLGLPTDTRIKRNEAWDSRDKKMIEMLMQGNE
jgi:dynein heavy chain 1